jgi:uncharacterized membrane protein YgaE (UPF0421/DUF939 family)
MTAKSPSLATFKKQLQRQMTAPLKAKELRRMLDLEHEARELREREEDFATEQQLKQWFLYGWNAAMEHVSKGKKP